MSETGYVIVPLILPKWVLDDFLACVPELEAEPQERVISALSKVLSQEMQADIEYTRMEEILEGVYGEEYSASVLARMEI